MSQNMAYFFRMCATCTYWAGSRSTDVFGNSATVDDGQPTGRCMCQNSGWFRAQSLAQNCCTSYERWAALKS